MDENITHIPRLLQVLGNTELVERNAQLEAENNKMRASLERLARCAEWPSAGVAATVEDIARAALME